MPCVILFIGSWPMAAVALGFCVLQRQKAVTRSTAFSAMRSTLILCKTLWLIVSNNIEELEVGRNNGKHRHWPLRDKIKLEDIVVLSRGWNGRRSGKGTVLSLGLGCHQQLSAALHQTTSQLLQTCRDKNTMPEAASLSSHA